MQIPIQSLNTKHVGKYRFPIDEEIYYYFLEKVLLDKIELVIADGSKFELKYNESNVNKKLDQS